MKNPYVYENLADPKLKGARRKFICWSLTKFQYLKWMIRLQFDRLQRDIFVIGLVDLYLDKDPDMMKCIEKVRDRFACGKNGQRTKTAKEYGKRLKAIMEREYSVCKKVGLTPEEVDEASKQLGEYLPEELEDF